MKIVRDLSISNIWKWKQSKQDFHKHTLKPEFGSGQYWRPNRRREWWEMYASIEDIPNFDICGEEGWALFLSHQAVRYQPPRAKNFLANIGTWSNQGCGRIGNFGGNFFSSCNHKTTMQSIPTVTCILPLYRRRVVGHNCQRTQAHLLGQGSSLTGLPMTWHVFWVIRPRLGFQQTSSRRWCDISL